MGSTNEIEEEFYDEIPFILTVESQHLLDEAGAVDRLKQFLAVETFTFPHHPVRTATCEIILSRAIWTMFNFASIGHRPNYQRGWVIGATVKDCASDEVIENYEIIRCLITPTENFRIIGVEIAFRHSAVKPVVWDLISKLDERFEVSHIKWPNGLQRMEALPVEAASDQTTPRVDAHALGVELNSDHGSRDTKSASAKTDGKRRLGFLDWCKELVERTRRHVSTEDFTNKIKNDSEFRQQTETLLVLTDFARNSIKAELDWQHSHRLFRLPTTREHFAEWVRDISGKHDLDWELDKLPCLYFDRPRPELIHLYLIDDPNEPPEITDELMPVILLRVIEPRPGQIKLDIFGGTASTRVKELYDELLADLEEEYQTDTLATKSTPKEMGKSSKGSNRQDNAETEDRFPPGRPTDGLYDQSYEQLRSDPQWDYNKPVSRLPSFGKVFKDYLEAYKRAIGNYYKKDEPDLRVKFVKAMERRRKKEKTEIMD